MAVDLDLTDTYDIPYSGEFVMVVGPLKHIDLKDRRLLNPPLVSRVVEVFDADRYHADLKAGKQISTQVSYYTYHIVFASEGDMFTWKLINL